MKEGSTLQPRASGGRRPHDDSAAGREHLLDAAVALFAERGIANTTVAQIAKAGKVTSAMVHYWFETREKLYDAIVEERLVPQIKAIWVPTDFERESTLQLIQGLLARMFQITAETPWLPPLWLREIIQVGGLLQERVFLRIPQGVNNVFRQKLKDAQARGEINPGIDPNLLFISMLALVMLPQAAALGWHKAHPGASPSRNQIEVHVTALLMGGLAGIPQETPKGSRL